MPLSHIGLAVLVTILWGVNFSFIKLGLQDMPPLLMTGLRFALAGLPIIFLPYPRGLGKYILGYGFCFAALQFGLLFSAMALGMSASLTSVIAQAQAMFTLIFAWLLTKEMIRGHNIIAMIIAMTGLGLIAQDSAATLGGIMPFFLLICAAASWGLSNIIIKKAQPPTLAPFIAYASLVAPIPLFIFSYFWEGPDLILHSLQTIDSSSIVALLYLAFIATSLCAWWAAPRPRPP
ncbi:MAG: EamA family transporter, partial [Pseudomonadota bacterium]